MATAKKSGHRYKLNDEKLAALKNQILIVLADYQSCKNDDFAFSRREGTRIEVADRILNNLKLIAQ